ncbi:MAG TPA: MFS transporter [Candidatus Acidoferrales bacterium]|nr:MFS transporter [Candidatus Acidoferrales bacterium]
MTNKPGFYGWKLVAVLFSLDFINMGFPYYGGSVIVNGYMSHDIAMSGSRRGAGFTLVNLFVGLAAWVVAKSVVKYGLRATFVTGSAVLCAGSLYLATYASTSWDYLIAFGVVIGTGISFATLVPASTAVSRWFRRYRGRAMGLALSASGFAGLAAPLLGKVLRAHGGNWRLGWYIVAGAVVFSALIALLLVRESPESLGQLVDGLPEGDQQQPSRTDSLVTKHDWSSSKAYATSAYWLIAIGSVTATFPFFLFVAHWTRRLTAVGISPSQAEWALSLLTIGTLVGRWIGGWLMDLMNARVAFVTGLCLYFLGSYLAIIVQPDSVSVAYLAALLNGTAYGWAFSCVGTMTAHYYGPKAFPKLYGTMTLLTSVCASPAAAVGGKIADLYGGYTRAFELDCVLAAVGIIAIAFATMPRPRTETNSSTQAAQMAG